MADLEYAYRIMATPDPHDTLSSAFTYPVPRTIAENEKIIGIYKPYFDVAEPAVLDACHAALSHYGASGYRIMDINLPYLPKAKQAMQ